MTEETTIPRTRRPLQAAVIGAGGFAQQHHRALRALEEAGECRIVCACDPDASVLRAAAEQWDFAGRGVRLFSDWRQMLDACAGALDLVTVPTPVPLHAPMHQGCVERGLACYLEKPPTLDPAELDAMLTAEADAARQTQVGFNFIVEDARRTLKRRLLAGEFGAVCRVCFLGLWPRATTYFTRAAWAGRLMLGGRLVLDSCLGNAMAHYLHNVLFWCGQHDVLSWAEAAQVRAELYRAHAIPGTDTVFVRGLCDGGAEIRMAASHACAGQHIHRETVECERATLTYITGQGYHVDWADGRRETGTADGGDLLARNFQAYFAYLRGETPRPLTRLVDARPFVHLNGLMYVAARHITTVTDFARHRSPAPDGGAFVAIRDIGPACQEFLDHGTFPSEQGVPWGVPGGEASREELGLLRSTVERMVSLWEGTAG